MAKKKKGMKDKMRTFDGDLIGDYPISSNPAVQAPFLARRARYWCHRFRTEAVEGVPANEAPAGFKEFVESLPGFNGWEEFASTWDLRGSNPYMVVYRIMSVWQEWDQVLERVTVPINLTAKQRHIRMKALEADYQNKRNK